MAERSKAPVSGTGHLWRGFESHYCHVSFYRRSRWNERRENERKKAIRPPLSFSFFSSASVSAACGKQNSSIQAGEDDVCQQKKLLCPKSEKLIDEEERERDAVVCS